MRYYHQLRQDHYQFQSLLWVRVDSLQAPGNIRKRKENILSLEGDHAADYNYTDCYRYRYDPEMCRRAR